MRVWVEPSRRDPLPGLTVVAVVGLVVGVILARYGMPPVNLHAPPHFVGIMDPVCGMTRESAATLRGDLGKAWWYNPASPLVIARRVRHGDPLDRGPGDRPVGLRPSAADTGGSSRFAAAFVVLDVYQQLHVDRLR